MAYLDAVNDGITYLSETLPSSSVTSINVVDGSKLPLGGTGTNGFILGLKSGNGNIEYIRCSSRTGNICTIAQRGIENSTGIFTWDAGSIVKNDLTIGTFKEIKDKQIQIDEQLGEKTNLEGYYYSEITYTKSRLYSSDYYIIRIPNIDNNGNPIKLKHGISLDNMSGYNLETTRNFAIRKRATLAVNAGVFNTSTGALQGISIIDGTIVNKEDSNFYRLGIKADNTLVVFDNTITAQQMINAGCPNVISAHYPLIQNGVMVGSNISNLIDTWNTPYQRQIIGQIASTKEIIILTVDGKNIQNNTGMTYPQCVDILLALGVTIAYALDGGGSASTIVNNVFINQPTDGRGYTERVVPDFLYITKEHEENFTDKINKNFGEVEKVLQDILLYMKDNTTNNYEYIDFKNELNATAGGLVMWLNGVKRNKLYLSPDRIRYYDYITSKNVFDFDLTLGDGKFKINDILYDLSDSGWTTPTLLNGVSITGHDVQYRRIGNRVYLRGRVTNLSALNIIFNLPTGYRPTKENVFFTPMGATNIGKANVSLNGDVAIVGCSVAVTTSLYFVLDNMSFTIN